MAVRRASIHSNSQYTFTPWVDRISAMCLRAPGGTAEFRGPHHWTIVEPRSSMLGGFGRWVEPRRHARFAEYAWVVAKPFGEHRHCGSRSQAMAAALGRVVERNSVSLLGERAGSNRSTIQDLLIGRRIGSVTTIATMESASGIRVWPRAEDASTWFVRSFILPQPSPDTSHTSGTASDLTPQHVAHGSSPCNALAGRLAPAEGPRRKREESWPPPEPRRFRDSGLDRW